MYVKYVGTWVDGWIDGWMHGWCTLRDQSVNDRQAGRQGGRQAVYKLIDLYVKSVRNEWASDLPAFLPPCYSILS